jgi:hypothetical protein
MSGRLVHHASRLAAAAALVIASGGVALATAAPAGAATNSGPGCSISEGYALLGGPARISAYYSVTCEDRTAPGPIDIARLVDGTWQSVATGSGALIYVCPGSTESEYEVVVAVDYEFEYACG